MNSHRLRPAQQAIKGRGAIGHTPHRFERDEREPFDDGWTGVSDEEAQGADDGLAQGPATQIILEDAKSAISTNSSPDIFFEQSVNPYRGCEHGCVYCYARPTHSYLGLSPGLDFETRIIAKRNVVQVLQQELTKPGYQPKGLVLGAATDCYQPVERELKLTRGILELLSDLGHPMAVLTKSSGIERDIDLLSGMARRRLAAVYVTVTTLDAKLARTLEPRAAAPWRRLRTIRALAQAGIPVGVSVAPQIPFINEDMEQVLQAAWDSGARSAFYTVLRLPWELSPIFQDWLAMHHPQRAERVMARVRDMRGGADYKAEFATRMGGEGQWAELIRQRFQKACARLGFRREREGFDTTQFNAHAHDAQASLF